MDPSDWAAFLLVCIADEPGIWTAALCRQINGLEENETSVRYCGACTAYANPRKRAAAAQGLRCLHAPCRTLDLTRLRMLLYDLVWATMISGRREIIPDTRQPRGWDWGTRYYIND